MRSHVALLRGINVSGRNKIAMSDLRAALESIGHSDVVTYIQSGNVVFTAASIEANTKALAADIESAISDRLALCPPVVVFTRDEIVRVVRDNPFHHEGDHRLLHAVFLRDDAGPREHESVAAALERARSRGSRDDVRVIGRTLYLWTPEGFGDSALSAELNRGGKLRTPMQGGTARNWRTVNALLWLMQE
jgi:uncharacterized protein (DUF1697 family)